MKKKNLIALFAALMMLLSACSFADGYSASGVRDQFMSTLDGAGDYLDQTADVAQDMLSAYGDDGSTDDSTLESVDQTLTEEMSSVEGYDEMPVDLDSIPAFDGETAYVVLNNNEPNFTEEEKQNTASFESYSELDEMGRCGVCFANIGQDLMPTEERGEIGMIKPSGWHTVKYDIVSGKYLYNRCHLIGYQLSGENDNVCNLITGTRYLNVVGMLEFENLVADYVQETGNHVLYRVTPVFVGDELVARGVLMEGYSVEDQGEGICYNVFCYNSQPGIAIDYATGDSWEDGTTPGSYDDPFVS